jgi:hypothetical protein
MRNILHGIESADGETLGKICTTIGHGRDRRGQDRQISSREGWTREGNCRGSIVVEGRGG